MNKPRHRYPTIFFVVLIFLASISGIVAAAPDQKGDPKIHEAPVSVAFVDAKAKGFTAVVPKDTPDNRGLGSIPSPVDKTHLKGKEAGGQLLRFDFALKKGDQLSSNSLTRFVNGRTGKKRILRRCP